jgi:hypothetical protein
MTTNATDVKDQIRKDGVAASSAADAIRDYLRTLPAAPALALLLLEHARHWLIEASNAIGDLLTPDEEVEVPNQAGGTVKVSKKFADAAAAAVADRERSHRHTFDADGICTKCGKVKSANGRKPSGASAADAPPVDTRTLPLPAPRPLGDNAADRFTDGGLGSSGVRR